MNIIAITGRLSADAEVSFTGDGKPVCKFSLAEDVGYGDKKTTNWYRCQLWGKKGESVAPYLTKGSPITAFGSLTLRAWTDKNGIEKISAEINVNDVQLPPKSSSSKAEQPAKQKSTFQEDSDIPF